MDLVLKVVNHDFNLIVKCIIADLHVANIMNDVIMTGYGHTELFKVTCYNFQPSRAC